MQANAARICAKIIVAYIWTSVLFFAEDHVKLQSDDIQLCSFSLLRTPRDFLSAKLMEFIYQSRASLPINVTWFGKAKNACRKISHVFYAARQLKNRDERNIASQQF